MLLAAILVSVGSLNAGPGGQREADAVYEIVAAAAVEVVPAELRTFLVAHLDLIREEAIAVAVQHPSDDHDEESHYVMLDAAADTDDVAARNRAAAEFPHGRDQAGRLFQHHRVVHGGKLPWVIAHHFERLVAAFEVGDKTAILHEVAMVVHFAADAALPFNTTRDRDGTEEGALCRMKRRLSATNGRYCTVRNRCQNAFVELRRGRFEYEVRVWPGRFHAPSDPLEAVFDTLVESHESLDAFLLTDEALRRDWGVTDLDSFQRNRSNYYDGLAHRAGFVMEARLEAGALLSANLIGAAWIRAGRPSERFFTDRKPTPTDATSPEKAGGPFVGSRNSAVFHLGECPHVVRIRPENRVGFPTAAAATQAGRKPCRTCKPTDSSP